ncbi:MAG: aminotransferase class III-fold pyridoxal phosphate-dependent enzyme [Bacteroidetes bacterium]|nr:MAG: aminotransferase class III-fold pyridoxal phosphate-dependent enzyme [Bacteroidota bacterium]
MNTPFTPQKLKYLLAEHFRLTAAEVLPLVGHADLNFRVKTAAGADFLLKISPPGTSPESLDFQNALCRFEGLQNFPFDLPRPVPTRNGAPYFTVKDDDGQARFVRLATWVPGRVFAGVRPRSKKLLFEIGQLSGALCAGLSGFDHPAAHQTIRWDNAKPTWIKAHLDDHETAEMRDLAHYFWDFWEKNARPHLAGLRRSVIHNDLNENNILVNEDPRNPAITGVIDFGDAVYTHTVNDLAIALAYAMMGAPDPVRAALPVIRGFHEIFPLTETEVQVLFALIAIRLLISATHSTLALRQNPDNAYLLISREPSWALLRKMREISPEFAGFAFRHACGWVPCPRRVSFEKWVKKTATDFAPVLSFSDKKIAPLDLGVGSLELGAAQNFEQTTLFTQKINALLAEKQADWGVGGYGEVRPVYTTDEYVTEGNDGPQWRSVHLGLDVWAPAGTPVMAPLDGIVHSLQNNRGDRNYGPTILLEHRPTPDLVFYTLYGHLSVESLSERAPGAAIKKGEKFATIGAPPDNGNWPPHLHFQVILDLMGWSGDFPGVAFPGERDIWLSLCPNPATLLPALSARGVLPDHRVVSVESLLEKRRRVLGKNLSVSYQKPLHIVRGYRQYLYAADGRRYLDTVNNVPHVGHQHPAVVRAGQRQSAVLNTNSRYLHETILRYAEKLLAKFPPELCVCYFVNSGSEANELAMRMARQFTGQKDMMALEVGYHGNTQACIEVSSYKFDGKGGAGCPPHTHILPMPDTFRGLYRENDPKAAEKYAGHAARITDRLRREGRGVAAFIGESILSCGGQIVPPPGFFESVYATVRAAGGLCIADEIQVGFGRVGTCFWGYELHGVTPDIVTLGKPIGNGHPLGAVITTRAVAEAFDNGMEFFSTFGGNPVSCAIGEAVLEVIESENLAENARQTGRFLKAGLEALKKEFPLIGDVRGQGLFLGFELIKNPETREPAPEQAAWLANRMRELGILMSTDGPDYNVLKIKPPLCFSRRNAEMLLTRLRGVLGEDGCQP